MLSISVRSNVKEMSRHLTRVQKKQVPFATAVAITKTAKSTAKKLNQETKQYFHRPTPFTQKAFTQTKATKRDLRSIVFAKDRQADYLKWGIHSGTRRPKRVAIVVPVGAKLNKYGNLTRNAIPKLLARKDTWSGTINGIPGIWQRNRRDQLRLLVYWAKSAKYNKIYPMAAIAERNVLRVFPRRWRVEFAKALRTAR